MTPRCERDVILEHALRDEENLDIALKIAAAYPDLCSRVIGYFLKEVEAKLAAQLGSRWRVCMGDASEFIARWTTFLEANFLGHPGQFVVVLGGDGSGYPKGVYLAVRSTSGKEHHEHVKAMIDQHYAEGRGHEYSLWYRYLDKAFSNWGSADSILLLYRKEEAVGYCVGQLERLARVVEKALLPDIPTPPSA